MRFDQFFWDRRYLVLFFVILMIFVSAVMYLEPEVPVQLANLIYLNLVGLVLFGLYLVAEYWRFRRFWCQISDLLQRDQQDLVYSLPEPGGNEQEIYLELVRQVYRQQHEQLRELYQEKQDNLEFITSWVHEIKTPIAACRLVLENEINKDGERLGRSIEEELDRIEDHVERALYYAKVDAFSKDYLIRERELEGLVKSAIKKHAKSFIYKKIRVELAGLEMTVLTDQKWLLFIIDQILSNALKYTDSTGTIRIIGEADYQEKRLVIEDSGQGICLEDLGRVFEKGFTGNTGREDQKATGMGLYLAKKLAQKLGHELSVDSVEGEYTRVVIHFPRLTDYFRG